MQGNAKGMKGSGCKVPGECMGMPAECKQVGAIYDGNTGERQGNVWKLVQSATIIQVNARGM